jgi:hypothetical protein
MVVELWRRGQGRPTVAAPGGEDREQEAGDTNANGTVHTEVLRIKNRFVTEFRALRSREDDCQKTATWVRFSDNRGRRAGLLARASALLARSAQAGPGRLESPTRS